MEFMLDTRPTFRHARRGYALAILSAAVLSTTALFIRHLTLTYAIPPLILAFWRDLFVVLTVAPLLAVLRPALLAAGRRHLPYLAAYGAVLATFNALWTVSVAQNGAAVSTVLVYCSAGFTAVLAWWLLGESLGWAKLLAVAVSIGGCALVSGASDPAAWGMNFAGILTGTLSGLGYAAYTLMGRAAALKGLSPWTSLLYTFGFAASFLLALNFVPGGSPSPPDLFWLGDSISGWGELFLLAAGPTAAGYGLYVLSLAHLPSSVVNLIVTLEVAFTAALAYVLLGERLTAKQYAGSLLIVGAVFLLRTRKPTP
jgi:drug/metabolite transporter (DMT)-like permease